jgi:hypothetical protein
MSIDEYSQGSTVSASGAVKDKAAAAGEEASKVASSVGEGTKQVAGEAAAQASAVVGQAKEQLHSLVGQTKGELDAQLSSKGEQVAGGLRNLVGQLDALANGRTAEAGPLAGYVQEARGKVDSFARRLEEGGPQGVIGDLGAFARRRPGVFLAGAAVVGFVVGRAVRAGAAASKEGMVHTSSSPSYSSSAVGLGMSGELPPPSGEELFIAPVGAGTNPLMPDVSTGSGLV